MDASNGRPRAGAHSWEGEHLEEREAGQPESHPCVATSVPSKRLQELWPLLQDRFSKEHQSWKGHLRSSHCVSRARKLMIKRSHREIRCRQAVVSLADCPHDTLRKFWGGAEFCSF